MNTVTFLKDIDRPEVVDWHPDFNEAGAFACEFVFSALLSGNMTENQTVNLIRCLFRLRFHTGEQRVFAEILRHCRSDSFRVRSVSVRLASGLIGLAAACPIPSRKLKPTLEDLLILKEGLTLGVDEATHTQAMGILSGRLGT